MCSFFQLEKGDEHCNHDYIEIRREDAGGDVMGRYCGDQLPSNIKAGANLWLRFRSDGDNPGQGFMATYNSCKMQSHSAIHYTQEELPTLSGWWSDMEVSVSVYGGEIVGMQGEVASPRYPSEYPPHSDYTWTITTKLGLHITVSFTAMDLQSCDVQCWCDYVKVRTCVITAYTLIVI